MALSITKQPPTLCLAGNPIVTEASLLESDVYTTIGVYGESLLTFTAVKTNGDVISADCCNNNNFLLYCKTYPTDSGFDFKDNSQGYSLNDWVKNCVYSYLITNYTLIKNFTITYLTGTNKIKFVAKKQSSDIYIKNIVEGPFSVVKIGVKPVKNPFAYVIFQIVSSSDELLYEESIVPDKNNKAMFFAEEIISTFLEEKYSLFIYSYYFQLTSSSFNLSDTFYIRCCKYENINKNIRQLKTTSLFNAISGKIDEMNYAYLQENSFDFFSWFTTAKREGIHNGYFTINKESIIYINYQDIVFINYFNDNNATLLKIETILDPERESIRTIRSISCPQYKVKPIEVSNRSINYRGFTKLIVNVLSGTTVIASVTYMIDYTNQPYKKIFLYRTELGVFESFNTNGTNELKLNEKREMIESDFPFNYSSIFRNKNIYNIDSSVSLKCNSGYLSKPSMMNALAFLNSKDVYEIVNDQFYPIIITSAKGWKFEEDENLFFFDFEYERNINNRLEIATKIPEQQ